MFLVVPAGATRRRGRSSTNAARDEPPRTKPVDEVFRSERRRLSLSSSLSSLTLSSLTLSHSLVSHALVSHLSSLSSLKKSLPNLLFCAARLS